VVGGVKVLRLTGRAQIEVWANAALEPNPGNGRLVASITGDTVVNHSLCVGGAVFHKNMVGGMHVASLALGTQIEVRAHRALVTSSHDWVHFAAIAPDVAVHHFATWRLLALALLLLTVKPDIDRTTWEPAQVAQVAQHRSQVAQHRSQRSQPAKV
jgi:hypothetical protein